MSRRRPSPMAAEATTAGFKVTVRDTRVVLVDTMEGRDPGISPAEAREIATRLIHAAAAAERARPCTR